MQTETIDSLKDEGSLLPFISRICLMVSGVWSSSWLHLINLSDIEEASFVIMSFSMMIASVTSESRNIFMYVSFDFFTYLTFCFYTIEYLI